MGAKRSEDRSEEGGSIVNGEEAALILSATELKVELQHCMATERTAIVFLLTSTV